MRDGTSTAYPLIWGGNVPDLEREAMLRCPTHKDPVFILYRRRTAPESPVFEHVLWPASPDVPPPVKASKLECPRCQSALVRGAP